MWYPMTIEEIEAAIKEAKQDLRDAERGYRLSFEPWANSSGMAEAEEIEMCESRLRWLERDLKIATGEIEDDNPF